MSLQAGYSQAPLIFNEEKNYIKLYNSNNATIFDILITQEATSIDDIAIEYIGNPNRLEFIANKFNGRIDLQLIKQ